uniref:Rho termination factor N-terminal domain-containing protein n=1 Tax=Mycena chlorophos TaxID=658473 RepID=A0ABQ0KVH1_MYCCL|nr:predicted protein [Mycena chlorophos]
MYTRELLRKCNIHVLHKICKDARIPSYSRHKKDALITHMLQYPAELLEAWNLIHGIPSNSNDTSKSQQLGATDKDDEAYQLALNALRSETNTSAPRPSSEIVYGWGPYVPPPPPVA